VTLLERLRVVDEQQVPRLAAGLRSGLDGLRHPGGGALRRLDDRYAARGPLGRLRRTPVLALALVAAVLLAAGLAAYLVRPGAPGSASSTSTSAAGPQRPVRGQAAGWDAATQETRGTGATA